MFVAISGGRLLFFVISILLDFILINAAGLHIPSSNTTRDGISSVTKKECGIDLYNVNGTCTKCPKGTHGINCSEKCQANMYGDSCLEKCDCQPHQECNYIHGCIDSLGICNYKESDDIICCDNFILTNGHCKACPLGTFWTNCSLECPDGYYGMFCQEKCECKTSECDKAIGCPKKDSWGICSNKESDDIICCDNLILTNGHCKACPLGTFWRNCSLECPDGYYGMFCQEKCECKTSECDKAIGCPKKGLQVKNSNTARDRISSVTKKECGTDLYNVNGTCTKCPNGTRGNNCSEKCQANMYGESCLEKCDCQPHQECNYIRGCIDSLGICSKTESKDKICCDNFILTNGYCKACPLGTFRTNCSLECPDGYYGMFCKETCECKTSECDKATGCPKKDCRPGTYGKNCTDGCPDGFYNLFCKYESYRYFFGIIPIVLGTVIFTMVCVCRRCRKTKPRSFVDISTYPTQKNLCTHDDYDHIAYAWNYCNNNTQERSKISKTALETTTREADMSNKRLEAGVYNTLNLRVFDNEEHRPLKRSRSESSSLYVKSSIPLEPSAFRIKRVLNCNRTSSLRLTKSTDRNGKAEKGITKTNKNDEPSFNVYVYDLATFQDKSSVSQRQLFLEELSSHHLYLKKY